MINDRMNNKSILAWRKYLSRLWIISEINEVALNVDCEPGSWRFQERKETTGIPLLGRGFRVTELPDRCLIVKAFERGRQKNPSSLYIPGGFVCIFENLRQARNLRISRVARPWNTTDSHPRLLIGFVCRGTYRLKFSLFFRLPVSMCSISFPGIEIIFRVCVCV